jgi:hypothetical protein
MKKGRRGREGWISENGGKGGRDKEGMKEEREGGKG